MRYVGVRDRNLIKIATWYNLIHRREMVFQLNTFITYKLFPSFCVYAHVAITCSAVDPIAVFDGPFVIIIQGRKPRSRALLSYHWFHIVVFLINLPLFITIYFAIFILPNYVISLVQSQTYILQEKKTTTNIHHIYFTF